MGGDFYDAWEVHDSWMITVGDVTGKGVGAAALTGLVRHTLRATSEFILSPAQLLARLDPALKKQPGLSLCTALCIRLHGDQLTLAVGGHPLPLRLTTGGVDAVGERGPMLGGLRDVHWHDITVTLEAGATLVAYIDGVTDATGEDHARFGVTDATGEDHARFGPERLRATLASCRGLSAAGVLETLTDALEAFQVGTQADDTAVLALRRVASSDVE